MRVATVEPPVWNDIGAAELVANAHLIAAAPDLFSSLRAMLFAYQAIHGGDYSKEPQVLAAYAALAKADGES